MNNFFEFATFECPKLKNSTADSSARTSDDVNEFSKNFDYNFQKILLNEVTESVKKNQNKIKELTTELQELKLAHEQSVRDAVWKKMRSIEKKMLCKICKLVYIHVN